jgi:WD40 repeat protein
MSVNIQKQTKLPAHKWQVSCVEFSPDGLCLASGSWDKTAIIWDLSTLEPSLTLSHHRQPVTCLSFQPKSKRGLLATGSADHTVALWNPATGALLETFQNHSNWVLNTSFSPNGRLLASASRDKLIYINDVESGKVVSTLTGHTTGVWACSFNQEESTSNDTLCSGAEDGGLKLWDVRSNSVVMSLVGGHEDRIKCCSWSPSAQYVASSSADGKVEKNRVQFTYFFLCLLLYPSR